MSFSSRVKNEICSNNDMTRQEAMSILSGIMKVSGIVSFVGNKNPSLKINTENAAIARYIFKILKNNFNIHPDVIVKKNNSLKKNNIYMIVIDEKMNSMSLMKELGILDYNQLFSLNFTIPKWVKESDENKKAFIKGSFLGSGSISNPEKAYHLEIVTHDYDYAVELSNLINSYNLNSKIIKRKGNNVIYIKEGDQITDMLNIMGAYNSLFQIENIKIVKQMRNDVNRLVNCETANLNKTVNASIKQIRYIKLIEKKIGLKRLPKNLREIAELRTKYPDESLKELGKMLNPPIGKSGVNHRLRKIEKIALELSKESR